MNRWRKHKSLAEKITADFTEEEIKIHIDKTLNKIQKIKLDQENLVKEFEEKAVKLADNQKLIEALVHAQHLKAQGENN